MKKLIFKGTQVQLDNLKHLVENVPHGREIDLPQIVGQKELEREQYLSSLSHYICDDDMGEAFDALSKQAEIDGEVAADEIVMMWAALESSCYTVNDLLDQIGL